MLKISGVDAEKFLNGQLTIDVTQLKNQVSQLAAHCNPQGRVISLFFIYKNQDAFYLSMPENMTPIAQAALKKYAVFYKVHIEEMKQQDETPHLHLIQFGITTLHPDTSEKFLPHDLNLPALNAVSFNKGCFTGQEIIARMQYRGTLKKKLYRASMPRTDTPSLLMPILSDEKEVGILVDYALDTINQCYYLLLLLPIDQQTDLHTAQNKTPITILHNEISHD